MKTTYKTYWGPNSFCRRPCVVFRFEDVSGDEMSRMTFSCVEVARYLNRHFRFPNSYDRKGSICWNDVLDFLSNAAVFVLNYVRGDLDESGFVADENGAIVFVEFHQPELVIKAIRILLNVLFRFSPSKEREYTSALNAFWDECHGRHPDFQAHALIAAAKSKNIYYTNLGRKIWLYGMGSNGNVFFETSTIDDLKNGIETDKVSGKAIFNAVGAPTARYQVVRDHSDLMSAIRKIGFPCAIKPVHAGRGNGVTANIRTLKEVEFAFAEASRFCKKSHDIMVEEFVPGRDYRLLFVRGDFVGCASSVAPFVIGDGIRSIRKLIDDINSARTRNLYQSGYLRPIKVDDSVIETLSVQNLGLDSILQSGQKVILRRNTNLGGGGVTEFYDKVHPDVLAIAARIARHSGLHSVGIDYITENINSSPSLSGGKFTELNKVPGVPLFLAAGYDITNLGKRFLGDDIGNIDVNLFIFNKDDLRKFLESYSGEYAILTPDIVVKRGKSLKIPNGNFRELLNKVLLDRTLHSLDIIAHLNFVEEFGFPTEFLSKVFVGKSCNTKMVCSTIERLDCTVEYAIS